MFNFVITYFQKLNWSVSRKISICLALFVSLIIVSNLLVFFAVQSMDNTTAAASKKGVALTQIKLFEQQLRNTLNIYNDSVYLSQFKAVINKNYEDSVAALLDQLKNDNPELMVDPEGLLPRIIRQYGQLSQLFTQTNTMLQNSESEKVTVVWASALEVRRTIIADTTELTKQFTDEQQAATESSNFSSALTKITVTVAGLLGVMFAVVCGWLLSSTIGKPLATTRKFLENIASGDLSDQLKLANQDELGDLAKALNGSVQTFQGLVESINIGSQVETVAKDLRHIIKEQNTDSKDQAARIQNISQALQQLTVSAQSITEYASMVAEAAQTTLEQAGRVDQSTSQVQEIAERLQSAVDKTGTAISRASEDFSYLIERLEELALQNQNSQEIIGIMAGIADQVHLLALNAAIEAAGGGPDSARFKVVAKQIKELASYSQSSAKDVGDVVNLIRRSIQETVVQSRESQVSIREVEKLSQVVSELVNGTLQRTADNQVAVNEILKASSYSARQAGDIKVVTEQQQSASQEILQTMKDVNRVITISARRNNKVADTSGELDAMSRSLTLRLAELKSPAPALNGGSARG